MLFVFKAKSVGNDMTGFVTLKTLSSRFVILVNCFVELEYDVTSQQRQTEIQPCE